MLICLQIILPGLSLLKRQPNKPNIKLFTLENRNIAVRRVSRYQRGNQNPYIEDEQTTQWRKEKVQKDNNHLQNIYIKLKIE